ncbi:unnamed protein product [Schistocephalus solidus]|uniref:Uncharacterized protein n=1 Tax=Schistocephalus solidus TaxID=70667 RepID=A0A183SB72_SCHSO|nr:unnamed protein product [Schistocephalus solidus]
MTRRPNWCSKVVPQLAQSTELFISNDLPDLTYKDAVSPDGASSTRAQTAVLPTAVTFTAGEKASRKSANRGETSTNLRGQAAEHGLHRER